MLTGGIIMAIGKSSLIINQDKISMKIGASIIKMEKFLKTIMKI